jgi:hypothetical protein
MQALSEMQLQQRHVRAQPVCAVFLALALLPRRELAQAAKCDTVSLLDMRQQQKKKRAPMFGQQAATVGTHR